ncbi:HalOD1 output domain-containing protein [Halomarina halobia]|uniref:HalOD1 output domain-containing protein n=1 Tax=Halomarina halobia TaxID=3033386 RepID=A0ABD6A9X9_9EURY|nr:HalOD1 output domain-containing protein [Halomarina sp. PSR21]
MQPSSRDDSARPSVVLIERIAELEGVDPLELDPPLNDVIDADALDELCAVSPCDLVVSFEYRGYAVRVRGDGTFDVRPSPAAGTSADGAARHSIRSFSD